MVAANEAFIIGYYFESGKVNFDMLMKTPRQTHHPLTAVPNWHEHLTAVSDGPADSPSQIAADLAPLTAEHTPDWRFAAATATLSRVLTVLAALEAVLPPADLATRETLTLHFIGAEDSEEQLMLTFEELLHLLPALRTLHCVLVGPQLQTEGGTGGGTVEVVDCCAACTRAGWAKSFETFEGVYHDYVAHPRYVKPDMAVAFHTGATVEFMEEWKPTLQHLVGVEHATVFTTYNKTEMVDETARLRDFKATFAVEGERNQWQSLIPRVDVLEEIENDIFYENMYWYILDGHNTKS